MSEIAEALRGTKCDLRQFLRRNGRAYKTERGIQQNLARHGLIDIGTTLAAHFDEVLTTLAQRGDLCVVDIDGEEFGGYIVDDHAKGFSEVLGVIRVPLIDVTRAFAV